MVYNNCDFNLAETVPEIPNTIFLGVNYFCVLCYYYYSNWNFSWKPTEDILLLLGKPYKYNRLPLLYLFWQNNLVKNLRYSFSPVPYINNEQLNQESWIKEGIDLLEKNTEYCTTDFDYEQWAHSMFSTLDRPLTEDTGVTNNFNGTDVCKTVYDGACIEVVSETHYNKPRFLTEKTYRPLMVGIPLLHAGYAFSEQLTKLGLRNYEPFTDHDCVCSGESAHHKVQMPKTVKAVKYFIENADHYQEQILDCVHHNRTTVINIATENKNKLLEMVSGRQDAVDAFFIVGK